MKNTNKIKLLFAFLGIFLIAAGCGSSNSGSNQPVTLNVWGLFQDSDAFNQLSAAYQQKYPNVNIVYTEKNVDTYESDLINALASGSGPDLFYIHNDWLPKYQDKLAPATAAEFTVKDIKDNFVDAVNNDFVSADGGVYAVPLSVDSLALYYNKDILGSNSIATTPKTWDELRADSKKIAKVNNAGFFTKSGVAMGTTSNIDRPEDIMYLLMLQAGTVPYTDDLSHSTIDQSVNSDSGNLFPGAQALSYYTSFADVLSDAYNWNSRSNYSIDAFANGQLAFLYGYSFTRATILQHSPNLNFDVAPVPQPELGKNLVNFANYWGYGVSKQSKNPNWAWDFLKFITQKQTLENFDNQNGLPSSRKDVIADQTSDPQLGVFAASNLTAKSFYKKDQVKVDNIIRNMIDDVTLRNTTVSAALSNAAQQIDLVGIGGGQ